MPHSPHASLAQPSYPHQSPQLFAPHASTPTHPTYDQARGSSTNTRSAIPVTGSNSYNPPRPIEVFHLTDSANNAIPQDIRDQFQQDENGHVLFFTAPPLDASRIPEPLSKLGHSVKYLAKKARMKEEVERKRRERDELRAAEMETTQKRAREDEVIQQESVKKLRLQAVEALGRSLDAGTRLVYQGIHGDEWEAAMEAEQLRLHSIQDAEKLKNDTIQRHEQEREEARQIRL